jgi:hypothetical protein
MYTLSHPGNKRFKPHFDAEAVKKIEERLILSPYLMNQYFPEQNWRAIHFNEPDPDALPVRHFVEFYVEIPKENAFFNFGAPHEAFVLAVIAYYRPVRKCRTWVSRYGGQWQCEEDYPFSSLCNFDDVRQNE